MARASRRAGHCATAMCGWRAPQVRAWQCSVVRCSRKWPDPLTHQEHAMIPGELFTEPGEHPIQVGSHYHFAETNNALGFDRAAARGMRLHIASGTAVRFEPGQERTVELVDYAGDRRVFGFQGLTQGAL